MKQEWLNHCVELSQLDSTFYSGCRKIIRGHMLTFTNMDDSLQMKDCGYTSAKMRYLVKAYLHEESREMAVQLWDRRKQQAKYGSVGFHCYNHLIKADPEKKSKRASVMGPCIQSVVITLIRKGEYSIDVFYRTTEVLKKFPADLVFLRDVLMAPFDFSGMKLVSLNCHFANITVHPMYFVTAMTAMDDPIEELEKIKERDQYFFNWVVKWTARYLCPEHHRGIAKFAQALRVHKDANERFSKGTIKTLQKYLRDNHPGYKNDYVDPEELEEDDD